MQRLSPGDSVPRIGVRRASSLAEKLSVAEASVNRMSLGRLSQYSEKGSALNVYEAFSPSRSLLKHAYMGSSSELTRSHSPPVDEEQPIQAGELAKLAIMHADTEAQLAQKQAALEAQYALLQAGLANQANMLAKLSSMHAAQKEADRNHERRLHELQESFKANLERPSSVVEVAKRPRQNWWDNLLKELTQINCGVRPNRAKEAEDPHPFAEEIAE